MESKTRLYLIIFLAFYFLAVSMIITGAVIPQWMDEFSVSAGRAGRLFAFYYLPYTIVTFCSGLLSQRWGKKVVLLLGQAFLAGGFFSVSTSPSFSLIEWGLFLMGVGGGFSEAPFTSLLSQIFPGEEGYALNLSQISFGLGAATAPFLAGFLLERGFSWRLFYLFPGMVSLVIFALLSREKLLEEKGMEGGGKSPLRRREGNGFIIVSFLAMFLYVGAEIGSSSWITTYLVKGLGGSLSWGGLALAVFWGALTIGRFVFAFLSRSLSYPVILRFSSFLSLIFLFFLNFTHEVHWASSGRSRVWLFCCLAFDSGLGSAKNGGRTGKSYRFCGSFWRPGSNIFSLVRRSYRREMGAFLYFLGSLGFSSLFVAGFSFFLFQGRREGSWRW